MRIRDAARCLAGRETELEATRRRDRDAAQREAADLRKVCKDVAERLHEVAPTSRARGGAEG